MIKCNEQKQQRVINKQSRQFVRLNQSAASQHKLSSNSNLIVLNDWTACSLFWSVWRQRCSRLVRNTFCLLPFHIQRFQTSGIVQFRCHCEIKRSKKKSHTKLDDVNSTELI